ncbi:MAG: helix-turn-helix transcriptional regulator [Phenylobacterium sp.]|uniref:helix-turn-helix domain-containing protein n=1 Tax=Phenylobacterium sp. TaxID=1871053 RepID=UPI001A1B0073|nr:AraC family transcriptional regulator [Phenylobacterium sp.]MBJ7411251.1 helix-turn-helix transcriptional regulator [Phenylobacterium sp.]
MSWDGGFVFGAAWAAYRGSSADNTLHAHAALQLAFGLDAPIRLRLEGDETCEGAGFLIRPGALHAITSKASVGLIYLEPQAPLAFSLLDLMGAEAVEPAPSAVLERLDTKGDPEAWLDGLQAAFPAPERRLDPRVSEVLQRLARTPTLSIADAARGCGLSESRLRELAREQLGLPLSSWLVWRKLERAAREIAAGASLAEAAVAGGFADQAHCARTMRRMFGVTPGMARSALG